jgi:hypothetical protein
MLFGTVGHKSGETHEVNSARASLSWTLAWPIGASLAVSQHIPGSFTFFLGAPSGKPSLSAFNYSTYYNGALNHE